MHALSEGTLLNVDLENIAIRRAFSLAAEYPDGRTLIAKRLFDHPTISANNYSYALCYPHNNGDDTEELFSLLLKGADRQDLETVKSNEIVSSRQLEFQQAVDQALKDVSSEGRHEAGRKKRIAILDEALGYGVPKDVLGIILAYHYL
jgi:hypothetical protein